MRELVTRVHSSYLRFPADVPSGGLRVVLSLRVCRFACRLASCLRRTFVGQVPGLTRRYGRWTERLRSTLAAVGLALAGRAGARMASVFGVSVSRSTVLRLVEALPELRGSSASTSTPRARAATYGTVLVDIETRRPVDLLPDREASSLAGREARYRDCLPGPSPVLCRRRHCWRTSSGAGRRPMAPLAQPQRSRRTVCR